MAGLSFLASPSFAQTPGWHYSPLPGEGDRAAMGCNREASAEAFTCVVVRCEDDWSVGLHLHSSVATTGWTLIVDREPAVPITLEASRAPYSGRITGDIAELIEMLKHGGIAYLDAEDGSVSAQIQLTGSLAAINRALFFCAPRSADQVPAIDGQDGAGDEAGEGTAEE
ncbi:MAG: hypothetical protein ACO1OG_03375 [Devosia sp.]